MKKVNRIALVVAKIIEIFHWAGTVGMFALLLSSLLAKDWLRNILTNDILFDETLSTCGFEVIIFNEAGVLNTTAVSVFAMGAVVILALIALLFRYVYLILKDTEVCKGFSEGSSPFKAGVVGKLYKIGSLSIALPVVGVVMGIVSCCIIGTESVKISLRFDGIIIGILVLCLTQFFSYGIDIQGDIDGLV